MFGSALSLGAAHSPSIALVRAGQVMATVAARSAGGNGYAQYFDLPANLPAGLYDLYVHNGYGGPGGWVKYQGFDGQPITQVEVVADPTAAWVQTAGSAAHAITIDFAQGNGGAATWDAIFQAAFNQARAFVDGSGRRTGAVIHIAAGTYPLSSNLAIPDRTILAGAGQGQTVLTWPNGVAYDTQSITGRPLVRAEVLVPWPLKQGTFGLQDLTLQRPFMTYSSNTFNQLNPVCVERASSSDFAFIRNVTCTGANTDAAVAYINAHLGGADNTRPDWAAAVFVHGAQNTEISGCTLDYPTGIMANGNGAANSALQIRNNTIRWRFSALNGQYALSNVIYAGNTESMAGTEVINGTANVPDIGDTLQPVTYNIRDIYVGENVTRREVAGTTSGEIGMGLDAGTGAYVGRAVSVSGTQLNLANATAQVPNDRGLGRVQPGAVVQILAGTGAGQWRHLVSPVLAGSAPNFSGVTQVTVDRAWDVDPDATSWVAIQSFVGHLIYHGNDLTNAPKLQLYYATHDVIVAENQIGSPGVAAHVGPWAGYDPGYEILTQGWHYQALGNVIRADDVWLFDNVTPMAATPNAQRGAYPGFDGPYAMTRVLRANQISAPAGSFNISMAPENGGFLVEGNVGLGNLVFPTLHVTQPMVGAVHGNTTSGGTATPLVEPSLDHLPADVGPNVVQY